jgi:hypothetical protein
MLRRLAEDDGGGAIATWAIVGGKLVPVAAEDEGFFFGDQTCITLYLEADPGENDDASGGGGDCGFGGR